MMLSRFQELINLYLDKEISEDQLNLLKKEIEKSDKKKKLFSFYCRLHHASKLALVRMQAGAARSEHTESNRSAYLDHAKTIEVDFNNGKILSGEGLREKNLPK